jgi:hypothetical protein
VRYAWPSRRKYPLDTRRHVHAAIAHFAANRAAYPADVQAPIARRIRERAKELGIRTPSLEGGGEKMAGKPRKGRVPPQLRPYLFRPGHRRRRRR